MNPKTLIICRGLPGSGKSTWALEQVQRAAPGDVVRVNMDSLREMLHDSRFKGQRTEKLVATARDQLILAALANDHVRTVICDDTNLNRKTEQRLRDLTEIPKGICFNHIDAMTPRGKAVADYSCGVLVQDFTHVDVDTCVKRDLLRNRSVGARVIRDMYRRYLLPEPPKQRTDLPSCVIVDIDGTVATMVSRGPYDTSRYHEDVPNTQIVQLVQDFISRGERIVFCSGRDEAFKDVTWTWLKEHVIPKGFESRIGGLFMRPEGDLRKDSIIKRELYENYIAPNWTVQFVLDDRDQVVRMWREDLGLTALQVAPGDF